VKRLSLGYGIAFVFIAILALTGCPQPEQPAAKSTDACLTYIGVKGSDDIVTPLSPLFSPIFIDYEAGVKKDVTSATVTVEPASSEVKSITINGTDVTSTKSALVSLSNGTGTAVIVVTAEDKTTTKTYTVNIREAAATVPLTILTVESVNGTILSDVTYNILDSSGNPISGANGTTNTSGLAICDLEPNQYVTIITNKAGYGYNVIQRYWVNALGDNTVVCVNPRLGMNNHQEHKMTMHQAYTSTSSSFGTATPIDLTDPTVQLDISGTKYLFVEIYGGNSIEPTYGSGFGARLGIDMVPSSAGGIDGTLLISEAIKGDYEYRAVYRFDLSGQEILSGAHALNIVAYDITNNRLHVPAIVRCKGKGAIGLSLSSASFTSFTADIRSYGLSREFFSKETGVGTFALNPYDPGSGAVPVSYRAVVNFKLQSGSTNVGIRGFDVYRKEGSGGTWVKIGSKNYGTLSTGSSGSHTYFDFDSTLTAGPIYYYKVKVWTDALNTKESDGTACSSVMAPFQANLSAPANRSSFDYNPANPLSTLPAFKFTVSNTNLWNATISDYFYFVLVIRNKTGTYSYVGLFRYNFAQIRFEAFDLDITPQAYVDIASANLDLAGKITLSGNEISIAPEVLRTGRVNAVGKTVFSPLEGATYEWDIYGDLEVLNGTSDHPCYFEKAYTNGVARSYGDNYDSGANTINGHFEFSVE